MPLIKKAAPLSLAMPAHTSWDAASLLLFVHFEKKRMAQLVDNRANSPKVTFIMQQIGALSL